MKLISIKLNGLTAEVFKMGSPEVQKIKTSNYLKKPSDKVKISTYDQGICYYKKEKRSLTYRLNSNTKKLDGVLNMFNPKLHSKAAFNTRARELCEEILFLKDMIKIVEQKIEEYGGE